MGCVPQPKLSHFCHTVTFIVSVVCSGSGVSFAYTRQAAGLLERVAVCVSRNEPVLLVGETGTGKTASIQYLAEQIGTRKYTTKTTDCSRGTLLQL